VPTDVEQAPSRDIFIVTGYSPEITSSRRHPFTGAWSPLIFGGKGRRARKARDRPRDHLEPRKSTLDTLDRPNSRIGPSMSRGTSRGRRPARPARIRCDVDFLDDWPPRSAAERAEGRPAAPIYILDEAWSDRFDDPPEGGLTASLSSPRAQRHVAQTVGGNLARFHRLPVLESRGSPSWSGLR